MTKRFWMCGAAGLALALAATGSPALANTSEAFRSDETKQSRKPVMARGGPIAAGDRVAGRLQGGNHTYTLEARAGQRLQVALTSDQFDPVLTITGPDDFTLENDDGPDGTLNSALEARLPAAGTYRIVVASFEDRGSGDYRLSTVDPANPVPAGVEARGLTLGEPQTGLLVQSDPVRLSGESVDYYSFTGTEGQRLTLEVDSDDIDTFLMLYLPDGRIETNDDRQGVEDTNSRLTIRLPMDGIYTLGASSYAPGESGEYTVRILEAADGVRTVRPASGNAQVYALSVGVAGYERTTPLERTDEDAMRVTHALREAGVLASGSVTLTEREATRENFAAALADLASRTGPDDTLLIFFSGHGEKVENMTTERDGSAETIELFDAALHDYELAGMLEGVTARTLLVIDACYSGGFDQVIDQADNRMGVFSSDADTLSLVATKEKSGGYISAIFRQALEGEGDMNGDGAVEAGELSEFMRRAFYRMVLAEPLLTDAEDFRDHQVAGYQHIIVDRGGDGMPFSEVLMDFGSVDQSALARR